MYEGHPSIFGDTVSTESGAKREGGDPRESTGIRAEEFVSEAVDSTFSSGGGLVSQNGSRAGLNTVGTDPIVGDGTRGTWVDDGGNDGVDELEPAAEAGSVE
jgi:hypothetical protein